MKQDLTQQVAEMKRGAVEIISEGELLEKLKLGRPLRIKAGFDPTAPDLHLGHTVLLQKLKQFQELGHQVVFLIGDFTATIGDPSGRQQTRPPLTAEEIGKNVKTYEAQVFKILDKKKTEITYNSEWLSKLTSKDLIQLTSQYTIARMLERDDFEKRYKSGAPIGIHEFFYPLLQGYDSVQLKADVELGGTDQKFNLLVGRELQRGCGEKPQVVITLPLLVGTDGVQKMSKSYGNVIRILDPANEIFGKIMSLPDQTMWTYYELLSDRSLQEVEALKKAVSLGKEHPKKVKKQLAFEIASKFHGAELANAALQEFENIFEKKGLPDEIEEIQLSAGGQGRLLVDLMAEFHLASSKSDAKRLIQQKAVSVNEEVVSALDKLLGPSGEYLLKVGKRRFKKIKFS